MTHEQYSLEFDTARIHLKIERSNISKEEFVLIAHQMSIGALEYVTKNNPPDSSAWWNPVWLNAVNDTLIDRVLLESC